MTKSHSCEPLNYRKNQWKSTDVTETKLYFIYLLFFSRLLYTYFCSIRKKGEVQGEVKRGLRHWVMRLILWDSQPVLQNKELSTKIKCTARKHPDGWKMNFQCMTGMWFLNVRINKILENSLHFFFLKYSIINHRYFTFS